MEDASEQPLNKLLAEEKKDPSAVQIEIPQSHYEAPKSHQFRALFRKAVVLQLRQKANSIIQIITPLIGLSIVIIFKYLALQQIDRLAPLYDLEFPFFVNLPYGMIRDPATKIYTTNCDQWYLYGFEKSASQETKDFIGYNKGQPINSPESKGMLETGTRIVQAKCYSPSNNVTAAVPYFNTTPNGVPVEKYLMDTLTYLKEKPLNLLEFSAELEELHLLPDGIVIFKVANKTHLSYHISINDKYYYQYHRNNGVTKLAVMIGKGDAPMFLYRTIEGLIWFADLLNGAYMKTMFPKLFILTGVSYLPMKLTQEGRIERLIHFVGGGIFPVCMSLLLPVFIYAIVYEKEQKVLEIMKMNGMKMRYYWLVNFLFDFIIYCCTFAVFFIYGGFVLGIDAFMHTSPAFQVIMFAGWGYAQIALAFFVSPFLSRAQSATIAGYVISLWLTVIAITLNNTLYDSPNRMPLSLALIPTFAFCRIYYRVAHGCGFDTCIYSLEVVDSEVWQCLTLLYIVSTVLLVLGIYLHEVVPQEYGVPRHPLFFLSWFRELCCGNKRSQRRRHSSQQEIRHEDEDCAKEEEFVRSISDDEIKDYPLVVKGLVKEFEEVREQEKKLAVNKVQFCVKKGEMFGLLGPNGAGKTTLISMLTGMYRPTSGEAWVGGFSLDGELDKIQVSIGVCPQFDILWPELTVEEHLLFYARLKGVSPSKEAQMVQKAMQEVFLQKFSNFKTKELSGGMRRRLSVAISLVGNPRVVFLDEPSTGLDPENRRQLWDILVQSKGKRAVVLTTHSMEEADVLCGKIGIISKGRMKCIGNQVHLKNKFGGGYQLFVNCYQKKMLRVLNSDRRSPLSLPKEILERAKGRRMVEIYKEAVKYIQNLIPSAKLLRAFQGNFVFEVPVNTVNVHQIFKEIERNKQELLISDWGFSQCTLDDVFTKLCQDL